MQIFLNVSVDFIDCNVDKGQQGQNVLSSRLFGGINYSFSKWQCLKLTPEKKQNLKDFEFLKFLCSFFLKFR